MTTNLKPGEFVCGHCGAVVGWLHGITRNYCPACLYSMHVQFGVTSQPPCGGLMRGRLVGDHEIIHRCTTCRFMMRGFTDDYLWTLWHALDVFGGPGPDSVTFYPQYPDDEVIRLKDPINLSAADKAGWT